MANLLKFDGAGSNVSIPPWTLEDGGSITFSDVIVGPSGTGTTSNAGTIFSASSVLHDFIAFIGGGLKVSVLGNGAVTSTDSLNDGDRVSVTISKSGTIITAQIGSGTPVTRSSTSDYTLDQFGKLGAMTSYAFSGSIAGTITLTGSDNRTYDMDQPIGSTVLVDTVNGQNGTLNNFGPGFGFVDDGSGGIDDGNEGDEGDEGDEGVQSIDLGGGADVWILAGQSQMRGANSAVPGIDDDYTGLSEVYQYGASGVLEPVRNQLGNSDTSANIMGPWRTFALGIISNGLVNNRPQILLPCAAGGSGFPHWSQGGGGYNTVVSRTNAAMALNAGNVLKGFLWAQGESNLSDSSSTHQTNLTNMHTGFVADIPAMTSATPFVSLLLHPDETVGGSTAQDVTNINTAITNFSNSLTNSALINSSDLTLNADSLHFDAASSRTIGTRYATAFYDIANPSTDPGTLTQDTIDAIADQVIDRINEELVSIPQRVWSFVLEGPETAAEQIKLLRAVAAGNIRDLGNGDYEILGQDGETVRLSGRRRGLNRDIQ